MEETRHYRGVPYRLSTTERNVTALPVDSMVEWAIDNIPPTRMFSHFSLDEHPDLTKDDLIGLVIAAMEQDIDEVFAGRYDRTPSKTIREWVIK